MDTGREDGLFKDGRHPAPPAPGPVRACVREPWEEALALDAALGGIDARAYTRLARQAPFPGHVGHRRRGAGTCSVCFADLLVSCETAGSSAVRRVPACTTNRRLCCCCSGIPCQFSRRGATLKANGRALSHSFRSRHQGSSCLSLRAARPVCADAEWCGGSHGGRAVPARIPSGGAPQEEVGSPPASAGLLAPLPRNFTGSRTRDRPVPLPVRPERPATVKCRTPVRSRPRHGAVALLGGRALPARRALSP